MTNAETIQAELARIQLEIETIARWREWTTNPRELKELDETERRWLKMAARWQRMAARTEATDGNR